MRSMLRHLCLRICLLFALFTLLFVQPTTTMRGDSTLDDQHVVRLPLVQNEYPWVSPFAVESGTQVVGTILDRTQELGVGSIRLHRLHWRNVQPTEQSGYDWSTMSGFEDELRALAGAGVTPIVIVHHSPRWATIAATSCAAIRRDKLGAFAAFMTAAVSRYKDPPFNVHHWELGNEPDVDPSLVIRDSVFGCWGDIHDPYYGGRYYGEMLKVVSPAIRSADPQAKILVGGLLLDKPVSLEPGADKPALFLKGILETGAAPHFDIVPYHAYPVYDGLRVDYDLQAPNWAPWGGWTLGKARFLRQIMDQYDVDKPLFLNETALGCADEHYNCDPPPDDFFQAQADYIGRTFARAQSEKIGGLTWYTLNGPGWRHSGLLTPLDERRPAFYAYKNLATRLALTKYEGTADYGSAIEGYSFVKANVRVHVVWSKDTVADTIRVSRYSLLHAFGRDGNEIFPTLIGDRYHITVGFSPVYLELVR
jgi:hypothetical protein